MPTFGSTNIKEENNDNEKENICNNGNANIEKNVDTDKQDKEKKSEKNEEYDNLNREFDKLKQKNDELEKKLMYLAAELQNTKRIAQQEKENATKFAINKFVIDAVNIYDVLLTAIEHTKPDNTDKNLFDGIKMTIGEFNKMFERIGLERVEPKEGDTYDFNKHNAVSSVKDKLPNGTIIKTIRAGYELFGRLIRPAMVIVSAGDGE